jgi:hypothetical protein
MQRAILLAAALALPAYACAEMMRPGLYRETSRSAGEKPDTSDECVTQKDIDDGLAALGAQKDPSCKVLDMKRSASSVSYRTVCSTNGVSMTTQANLAFTRDTFDGQFTIKMVGAGAGTSDSSKIQVSGKRIGECKEQ